MQIKYVITRLGWREVTFWQFFSDLLTNFDHCCSIFIQYFASDLKSGITNGTLFKCSLANFFFKYQ